MVYIKNSVVTSIIASDMTEGLPVVSMKSGRAKLTGIMSSSGFVTRIASVEKWIAQNVKNHDFWNPPTSFSYSADAGSNRILGEESVLQLPEPSTCVSQIDGYGPDSAASNGEAQRSIKRTFLDFINDIMTGQEMVLFLLLSIFPAFSLS